MLVGAEHCMFIFNIKDRGAKQESDFYLSRCSKQFVKFLNASS